MVINTQTRKVSSPVETGRRQRRREETIEKIFMAAMELFSHKGFAHTTVEEITRAADVGKGTFFNYFPSKEHVLGYLVGTQKGVVEQHRALARAGEMACDEILIALGRNLLKFPGKSPQMARSVIAAFLGNVEVREYIVGELDEGRRWIAEIIRLGQQRAELRDEMPAADLARVFQHSLFGTVLLWALDPSSSLEKQFNNTMQTFFSGLKPSSKAQPAARRRVVCKAARHKSEAR
jgi:AcrR family transcriptional regulator